MLPRRMVLLKNLSPAFCQSKTRNLSAPPTAMQALFARATAPVKNMLFMCFMAWMSGNGIQIFSIMMTFNLLQAPISAIMSSGQSKSAWPCSCVGGLSTGGAKSCGNEG